VGDLVVKVLNASSRAALLEQISYTIVWVLKLRRSRWCPPAWRRGFPCALGVDAFHGVGSGLSPQIYAWLLLPFAASAGARPMAEGGGTSAVALFWGFISFSGFMRAACC